ncbi:MAG: hypothetical protein [Anelloviridae sp.]|nr:MAG: hypothetical protein [Anelloviridae sp.]
MDFPSLLFFVFLVDLENLQIYLLDFAGLEDLLRRIKVKVYTVFWYFRNIRICRFIKYILSRYSTPYRGFLNLLFIFPRCHSTVRFRIVVKEFNFNNAFFYSNVVSLSNILLMSFRRSFCFLRCCWSLSSVVDVSSSSEDVVSDASSSLLSVVGHQVAVSAIGKRFVSDWRFSVILFAAFFVSSPLRSSNFQRRCSNGAVGFCNEVVCRKLLGIFH